MSPGALGHFGWYNGRVCVGSGPVRMRFTTAEAAELVSLLQAMLEHGNDNCGEDCCGKCDCPGQDEATSAPEEGSAADDVSEAVKKATRRFYD
jgi:hypothetical protein